MKRRRQRICVYAAHYVLSLSPRKSTPFHRVISKKRRRRRPRCDKKKGVTATQQPKKHKHKRKHELS